MRLGLTTGACFIAAAKAAIAMLHEQQPLSNIIIELPIGLRVEVKLSRAELHEESAVACVIKDAGDNAPFDVTHGVEICVEASIRPGSGNLIIVPVRGLGIDIKTGRPAISNRVMEYLMKNIREVVNNIEKVDIVLKVEIPKGEELYEHTLNKLFDITGGIALLGEKGIELPTGNPYYSPHLEHVKIAIEESSKKSDTICIVTGGRSLHRASKLLREVPIIDVGDHVGFAIGLALEKGFKNIIVISQIGKFVKLSGGVYMLHHHYADARIESLVCRLFEYMLLRGFVDIELLSRVLKCKTIKEAFSMFSRDFCRDFIRWLVDYVEDRIRRDFRVPNDVTICVGTFLDYEEECYFSRSCVFVRLC